MTSCKVYVWCLTLLWTKEAMSIRLDGIPDLMHNFEAIDPEVLDLFTFNHKQAYKNKEDAAEIDIMDVDTSDILNCFSTLSYNCFQKKILIYLDSLNRADKINLFGGYLSFVRVSKGLTPPITEQLLASRHINDENTLTTLLREVFEDFVEAHILRISVPVINTRLDARGARGHCYDFSLADAEEPKNETARDGSMAKDPTCYRGDQSMVALSSAVVMKMLMLLPTMLKVIAAKAVFGLVMGMVSVILSKMALLPLLLSYANKNKNVPNGSFRQGVAPTGYSLTTDNYGTYYDNDPSKLTTGAPDYGSTGNEWSEKYASNKISTNVKDKYIPRKERYRSMFRRHVHKPRKSTYPETVVNGKLIDDLTTAETNTEQTEDDSRPGRQRMKRMFNGTVTPISN